MNTETAASAFTRKNVHFVTSKEPSFIRNPPRFSRRDFDELAPSFRMGKVGWNDYRWKIKKKKESMRRGRQESAKGGWGGKKRNDRCTTIAVHSCRNGETGHGGMRGVTITRVQHTRTALTLHLHACECLPLCSSSFTRELSPLCTNPRGN